MEKNYQQNRATLKKTVLVTGATGFVGSHLVKELLKKNYKVRALVRNNANLHKINRHKNLELFFGDITKDKTLKNIGKGVNYVVHLAAQGHVSDTNISAYKKSYQINVKGTNNLLKQLIKEKNIKKIIHFSSTAAMGLISNQIINEQTKPRPQTPYQKSKLKSEKEALFYLVKHKLPIVIFRPCMIYGPGGYGEFYKFYKMSKIGLFPKIGKGKNLTPMVYVEDVVKAVIKGLKKAHIGEVYLVVGKRSYTMDEIRNTLVRAINIKRPYIYVPNKIALFSARIIEIFSNLLHISPIVSVQNIKSTIANREFSYKKAKSDFDYLPKDNFEKRIKKTVVYFENNK